MHHFPTEKQQSEEDGPTTTESSALQQYLDHKLTVHAAAIQIITDYTAEGGYGSGGSWVDLLETAQEHPEQQEPLVALFSSMTQLLDGTEPTTTSTEKANIENSLHHFGWEVRDSWNYFDPPPDTPDRTNQRRLWTNLNAFTARLAASPLPSLVNFGLWSLRDALEEEYEDGSALDGYIPAAAQWIFYAGSLLYACEDEIVSDPIGGDPYRGGDLWTGKHGFCKERWQFWKVRFEWAAGSDLQLETKRIAREAVDVMNKIDGAGG